MPATPHHTGRVVLLAGFFGAVLLLVIRPEPLAITVVGALFLAALVFLGGRALRRANERVADILAEELAPRADPAHSENSPTPTLENDRAHETQPPAPMTQRWHPVA